MAMYLWVRLSHMKLLWYCSHLVYSWHPELPSHIHGPDSPLFPLVAFAKAEVDAEESPSIEDYARAARQLLKEHLTAHGAVLLRGLPLTDEHDFSRFVSSLGWEVLKLGGGGTQRSDVAKGVRTASDEPAEHTIEPHMDMAHSKAHPKRIAFFCLKGPPPGVGGETVLTDMRAVYKTLRSAGIPQAFDSRGGVAYRKRCATPTAVERLHYHRSIRLPLFHSGLTNARRPLARSRM